MVDKAKAGDKELFARAAIMFLFYILFNVLELVIGLTALVQLALSLFLGKPNENLTSLGKSLSIYAGEIVEFLTFSSEKKPYPFGEWPRLD